MKKSFIIAALAAALSVLGGCNTNEPEVPGGKVTVLKANIAATKTDLQSDQSVNWSAADKIVVNGVESAELTDGGATANFTFEGELTAPFKAVYPASSYDSETSVNLPAIQENANGNFGTGADLLYSYVTDGDELTFSHAMAFLKIPIIGGAKIASVKVTGGNGEQMSGPFGIDIQTGVLTAAGNGAEDNLAVTATVDAVDPTVYVAVPPGNYAKGFTFVITDDKGNTMVQVKPSADQLVAGTANATPAYTFEVIPEGEGSGTEDDPYLIRTPEDMVAMQSKATDGGETWFKVMNNIDMSSVTSWTPVNSSPFKRRIHFDGNKKTISNFNIEGSANYMSVFGVFNGSVKDVVFKDCSVNYTGTASTPVGLVGGWLGISNASFDAAVTDVHAINCTVHNKTGHVGGLGGDVNATTLTDCSFSGTVTSEGQNCVGGVVGKVESNSVTIKRCSFDGTVERTPDNLSGYRYTGGVIGALFKGDDFSYVHPDIEGCESSGKLIVGSTNSVGGICGGCDAYCIVDFKDCHSAMDIEAPNSTVVGGILGYCSQSTFTDCSYDGNITATNYVGGIVPHSNGIIVCVRCHSSGSITGGKIIGGIIGQSNPAASAPAPAEGGTAAKECWSTMDITVSDSYIGGIVGCVNNDNFPLIIENCWYSGTIKATESVYAMGGIVGDAPRNSTIKDCWTEATIITGYAGGGIAGRLCGRGGGSTDFTLDINCSMTGCIYAGPSVSSLITGGDLPGKHYSSGAMIGFSSAPNTLSKNYRIPSMTFFAQSNADQEDSSIDLNALFDQEDSSPSNPLVWPYDGQGTNNSPRKYWRPYHGKAYAAGMTVSQVAREIGWSTSVWDLSGDKPALVNNK
ncbi:MAG: hypothetical protein IJM35_02180 [Bacteroidales bacterium]|nr:hypothetical protein [Bacteroidales bacterium]